MHFDSFQPQVKLTRQRLLSSPFYGGGCRDSEGSRPCREMEELGFESGLGSSPWCLAASNQAPPAPVITEGRALPGFLAAGAGSRGPLPTPGRYQGFGRPPQDVAPHLRRQGILQSDVEAGGGGRWDYEWVPRRKPLWPGHTEHIHFHPLGSGWGWLEVPADLGRGPRSLERKAGLRHWPRFKECAGPLAWLSAFTGRGELPQSAQGTLCPQRAQDKATGSFLLPHPPCPPGDWKSTHTGL